MKTNRKMAYMLGSMIAMLVIIYYMFLKMCELKREMLSINDRELEQFQEWAEGICANGLKEAGLLDNGTYQAICN